MGLETNVFTITNLRDLSSQYRLYSIRGLDPEQNEYYQNCDYIKKKLSFLLKNPVTLIQRNRMPYLVVRTDREPPASLDVTRLHVIFEQYGDTLNLDYTVRSPENDEICIRFLQFLVQEPLNQKRNLWQPGTGKPLFERSAAWSNENIERFEGYSIRVVPTADGGLGFCVDVTNKFVSKRPLSIRMTREQFNKKWKNSHCIYHYGHKWYEVQLKRFDDRTVTEYRIDKDNRSLNLLQFIAEESQKPIPLELSQLPHDASIAIYHTSRKEERGVPTGLCYSVIGTRQNGAARSHHKTILPAYERSRKIREFIRQHLLDLKFGQTSVQVASEPLVAPKRVFPVPDLSFANGITLSVQGTPGARQVPLEQLGETRLALLEEVGLYDSDPLDRQYLILPQSVADSWGPRLIQDLSEIVNQFYRQPRNPSNSEPLRYEPILITYDDRRERTFVAQGIAILKKMEEVRPKLGYAVVMIHHVEGLREREEDPLEAMAIQKLKKKFEIRAAVIHSKIGEECYELPESKEEEPTYRPKSDMRKRLAGYLRNVAINKVLLTNHRWPFLLATRLHADVVIGIDVKVNTAGLVVVGHNGGDIRFLSKDSKQKEKLEAAQLRGYILEILRDEAGTRTSEICNIVIHRDGKMFPSELKGARDAIQTLKAHGTIASDATLTIVEIPKHSLASLRLFETTVKQHSKRVYNPEIGTYYLVNDTDAYLCSTGHPFSHPGTVRPLHVRRIEGPLSLEQCLEDIYYLTMLAWSRPEDCTRYPITIKLNDRFLGDEATEYDDDAVEAEMALEEE